VRHFSLRRFGLKNSALRKLTPLPSSRKIITPPGLIPLEPVNIYSYVRIERISSTIFPDDGSRATFRNIISLTKDEIMENVQHGPVLRTVLDLSVPYKEEHFLTL
jgi:hypothetical protein